MNFDKAFTLAVNYLRANIVASIWGHPGVGKSALGKKVAKQFELLFLDMRLGQLDPLDLNGFAHKDETTRTFDYFPWARFPLEGQEPPTNPDTGRPYKGWLIMFDEINTAPRQNLAAAYKIFLDRMIGQLLLHPKVRIMMGGNLVGEGLAGALPSPLVSRAAHIVLDAELVPEHHNILGPHIYNFLLNHPAYCYKQELAPNTPFPTLRTWEMVHDYEKANGVCVDGFSGIVGGDAAVAYVSHRQTSQQMADLLAGVQAFPLEHAQDLIDFIGPSFTTLEKHLHRFPGEWQVIAKATADSLKLGEPVTA